MPRPTPDDIVVALRDFGCKVGERPYWWSRGTKHPFNPVGQINHHDALTENVSDRTALQIMENGRPDLTGPLCNGWIDSDSVVYLVAYGNANHAGRGEADVLERVKRGLAPLGDARDDPDKDTIVGNSHYWGWEVRNAGTGTDPYEQLDAMVRANAALAQVHGWSENRSIAHREHTARKPDPAGIVMPEFRRLVGLRLHAHTPPHGPFEEDVMIAALAHVAATYRAVTATKREPDPNGLKDWTLKFAGAEDNADALVMLHTDLVSKLRQFG